MEGTDEDVIADTQNAESLEENKLAESDKYEEISTDSKAEKLGSSMEESSTAEVNKVTDMDDVTEPVVISQDNLMADTSKILNDIENSAPIPSESEEDSGKMEEDTSVKPDISAGCATVVKKGKQKGIVKKGYNMRKNVRETKDKNVTGEKRKFVAMIDKVLKDTVKSTKLQDGSCIGPKQNVQKDKE